jgi:hypothetical protein
MKPVKEHIGRLIAKKLDRQIMDQAEMNFQGDLYADFLRWSDSNVSTLTYLQLRDALK